MENEFKATRVRVKKRKDAATSPSGSGAEGHEGGPSALAAVAMMGSVASSSVDTRSLPLLRLLHPRPRLRGLSTKRQLPEVASGVPPTSSHGPSNTLASDDKHSVVVGER